MRVAADPYEWPLLAGTGVALLVIDMQHDFLAPDGWFASIGVDVEPLRAIVPTVARLMAVARAAGVPVIHTRQGNQPDLADLPAVRQAQGERTGSPIGTPGPWGRGLVVGEPGWAIVDECAPAPGELVIEKPGYSSFARTPLAAELAARGIGALAVIGVTANVCVLSTLLAAADLGIDCLVVGDAVAAVDERTTATVLDLVRYQAGLFGTVTSATALLHAWR